MSAKPASVNLKTTAAKTAAPAAKATKTAAAPPKGDAAAETVTKPVAAKTAETATKPVAAKAAETATKPPKAAAKAKAPVDENIKAKAPVDENATADDVESGKKRVQMATVLNINISQARCQTHLKQNLGSEEIAEEIAKLRHDLKGAKDQKQAEALKAKIAELSKKNVRISSSTPIAAAVVMDGLITELVRYAMDQAIASDRKIVEVAHVHEGNPSSLVYYPIFNKLPAYVNYSPENEDELHKKQAAANKAVKEAREAKKNAAAPPAQKKANGADEHAVSEEDDEDEHTKTSFITYVDNALQSVKKDEAYATMRISSRMREYLSDLIVEGLKRMAMLCRILVQEVMDVRTMNAEHIKAVIRLLMADEGRAEEQIDEVKKRIDEKLEVYHAYLQSELDKKAEAMSEEEKAQLASQKVEAEKARKIRTMEAAKTKAQEAMKQADEIAKEIANGGAAVKNGHKA
ncbi:MAG: hypothetical protein WC700_10055 [Gemmatimonadaceae bacterium]|jgi:hypothetical protein